MTTAVIIPAFKKNVAFTDDLVKKLGGIPLVQRAIDKARSIVPDKHIYVVTDSEEIRLICHRNAVNEYYNKELKVQSFDIFQLLRYFLSSITDKYRDMILLSPYAPLVEVEAIRRAFQKYQSTKARLLISVKKEPPKTFLWDQRTLRGLLVAKDEQELLFQSQAFQIIDSSLLKNGCNLEEINPMTFELNHDLIDILTYQDWWVCEKLLKRKRIVFRVIGGEELGMGHIYRSLTLAHEITDHEVRLVCDENSRAAVTRLAGADYWLEVYKTEEIADRIIDLKPDLLINDILDTDRDYIQKLKDQGIRVVNFEDFGSGAGCSDLTINELFDTPIIPGNNILWGRDYFFVREEFNLATPNEFKERVESVLILFGASDLNDFTGKIFCLIKDYCRQQKIKIHIITGGGYPYIQRLQKEISDTQGIEIHFTHATGVVSNIMEKVQIAIAANGRTAYELGHMNIPSIILSHHKREMTHLFSKEENGYIPIGLYEGRNTDNRILEALDRLVTDTNYRRMLFERLKPHQFIKNKDKVVKEIIETLGK